LAAEEGNSLTAMPTRWTERHAPPKAETRLDVARDHQKNQTPLLVAAEVVRAEPSRAAPTSTAGYRVWSENVATPATQRSGHEYRTGVAVARNQTPDGPSHVISPAEADLSSCRIPSAPAAQLTHHLLGQPSSGLGSTARDFRTVARGPPCSPRGPHRPGQFVCQV